MNTMKDFYASLSSASRLEGPYLEALSEITKMNSRPMSALKSDLGWQEWGTENQQNSTV